MIMSMNRTEIFKKNNRIFNKKNRLYKMHVAVITICAGVSSHENFEIERGIKRRR